jgi:hypothetical protein
MSIKSYFASLKGTLKVNSEDKKYHNEHLKLSNNIFCLFNTFHNISITRRINLAYLNIKYTYYPTNQHTTE